jgi:DNA-directed RNA polymerase
MTQPSVDLIERQLHLETIEQKEEALQRLDSRTLRAEQRSYASATVWGKRALEGHIEACSAVIADRLSQIGNGRAGRHYATVRRVVGECEPEVLALLAMKTCLDVLGKENRPTYITLCTRVGHSVQSELRLRFYQDKDPALFDKVSAHFHSSSGTQQRLTVYKKKFNDAEIHFETWSTTTLHEVGAWLVECIQRARYWFTTETAQESKRKRSTIIRFSPEFLDLKDAIMDQAKELASCLWPMICPPKDWSNDTVGGYLTGIERGYRLVRGGCTLPQGDLPLAMLNRLQAVSYTFDRRVYEVMEHCFQNMISIGQFKRQERKSIVNPLTPESSEEEIRAYKRARRELEDRNAQLERENIRTTEVMYIARKFIDQPRLWLCWNYDYRGRTYTIQPTLTPQGTDAEKALYLFADEGPINEWWIAFHVANCAGHDKATMSDRIEWTRSNTELISAIATDPIGNLQLWANAGDPWCFLQACFEYHECCIAKTKQTSGLMIGIDATASGLQHLSAATYDRTAATMVNVVRTEAPSDAYAIVAEKAKEFLPKHLHEWMNRKVTKRCCMTLAYGVTRHSARGYIRDALLEQGRDLKEPGLLTLITKAVYENAVPTVFSGPISVMNWIKKSVRERMLQGADKLQWVTPSGFVVAQDLRKSVVRRVNTHLMGTGRITASVYLGPGDVDINHHVSATSPNLVHSWDSSLLHFTFSEWDKPFSCIHDCVMARSCDMENLSKEIRLHFAEMYKGDPLKEWAEQIGIQVPDEIMVGDLDVDDVNESPYFFC